MRRIAAALPLLLLLGAQAAPAPSLSPDAQAIARRMASIPLDKAVESVDAYQPAEAAHGRPGQPYGSAPEGAVTVAALDRAEAYAAAQNSFALIVAHQGRIVREQDWLRLGELVRNRGAAGAREVVSASWIAEMTRPAATNPNYGLQVWRGSPFVAERRYNRGSTLTVRSAEPFAADDVAFFDGAGAQRVHVVPSVGLTIVRIGKPTLSWDDTALVNMVLAGVKR